VPIQWYYSQADPIWPDGPFKKYEQSFSFHVTHLTSSLMSPLLSLDLSFSFSSLSGRAKPILSDEFIPVNFLQQLHIL
jgi:hypothetical protein